MKRHVVKEAKVSLCRACKGVGMVREEREAGSGTWKSLLGMKGRSPSWRACPVCGGSGRVTVRGEMDVEVEAFDPGRLLSQEGTGK